MLTVRADEFARLKVEADKFDRAIIRSLRKRIKDIGKDAVEAVQKSVLSGPGEGAAGSRAGIAAGTRLSVSFSARSAGAKITTTNAQVDADHKGIVAAYNQPNFRHPVFGNRNVWAVQTGKPYFGASIEPIVDKRTEREMKAAIDDAVRAFGGRGK